jgi:hypothetical protein
MAQMMYGFGTELTGFRQGVIQCVLSMVCRGSRLLGLDWLVQRRWLRVLSQVSAPLLTVPIDLAWSCIAVCICMYLGPSRPYMLSENSLIKAFV